MSGENVVEFLTSKMDGLCAFAWVFLGRSPVVAPPLPH